MVRSCGRNGRVRGDVREELEHLLKVVLRVLFGAAHKKRRVVSFLELMPPIEVEPDCCLAAKNGHLNVVKWARALNVPWGKHACYEAAFGGHLEVLKWARENGCRLDEGACAGAAAGDLTLCPSLVFSGRGTPGGTGAA